MSANAVMITLSTFYNRLARAIAQLRPSVQLLCRCANGCTCQPEVMSGSLTYDQIVTFINSVTPTSAPACHINIQLTSDSPPGSKLRITGMAVTSDPGELNNARIGEDKYMAWLTGEKWAA